MDEKVLEKAVELSKQHCGMEIGREVVWPLGCEKACLEMAEWKDEQIKAERERVINLVVDWMNKNLTFTHPRKEVEMPFVNITKFKDNINQILNEKNG